MKLAHQEHKAGKDPSAGPKQTGESTLSAEEGIKAHQGLLAKENGMFLSFKSSRSNPVTRQQVQVVHLGDDPRTQK